MSVVWDSDFRSRALPVEQQGQRNTCLALAITSGRRRVSDFSAEYAHFQSEAFGGRGRFESIRELLTRRGQPPEDQWPYDPRRDEADSTYEAPNTVVGPFETAVMTIEESPPTFQDACRRTADGAVLVLGMRVLDSLYLPANGVVLPGRPVPDAHAVLCVGTATFLRAMSLPPSEREPLLCIQNSWGTHWGDGGYGYLPESTYALAALKLAEISRP